MMSLEVQAPPLVYFESVSLVKNSGFDNAVTFQFVCQEDLNNQHLVHFELPGEFDDVYDFDESLNSANPPLTIFSGSVGKQCTVQNDLILRQNSRY
jgi:hypothetical protein